MNISYYGNVLNNLGKQGIPIINGFWCGSMAELLNIGPTEKLQQLGYKSIDQIALIMTSNQGKSNGSADIAHGVMRGRFDASNNDAMKRSLRGSVYKDTYSNYQLSFLDVKEALDEGYNHVIGARADRGVVTLADPEVIRCAFYVPYNDSMVESTFFVSLSEDHTGKYRERKSNGNGRTEDEKISYTLDDQGVIQSIVKKISKLIDWQNVRKRKDGSTNQIIIEGKTFNETYPGGPGIRVIELYDSAIQSGIDPNHENVVLAEEGQPIL